MPAPVAVGIAPINCFLFKDKHGTKKSFQPRIVAHDGISIVERLLFIA
jgi:hypothetical protein